MQLLLIGLVQAIDIALSIGECLDDSDCLVYSRRLESAKNWGLPLTDGGYACVQSTCQYVVSSGNICRQSSDCSYHSYLTNIIKENRTELFPLVDNQIQTPEQMQMFLQGICSPEYCTQASSCSIASEPYFGGLKLEDSKSNKCCRGAKKNQICRKAGANLVEVCTDDHHCIPDPQNLSSDKFVCSIESKKDTQWIGIILTLISAATTNMGLNLQKLALRKRHLKKVQKKQEERIGIFYKLTALKASISNFYKNISTTNLDKHEKDNKIEKEIELRTELKPEHAEQGFERRHSLLADDKQISLNDGEIRLRNGVRHHVQSYHAPDKDMPQFQKHVGFSKLLKNPRWMLGMLVFIIGNLCNFAALNFAAQSLLAPLNSISLVVNVFLAPLINGEMWTWKDIVGIALIISGGLIVVIFSGFTSKDYNLCVLLKLFRQTATIAYLTITLVLILIIYFTIITVEKNLDLKDGAAIVMNDKKIDEHGTLMDVVPVTHSTNVPEILVTDDILTNGEHIKTITVTSPTDLFKHDTDSEPNSDSDSDDDDRIKVQDCRGEVAEILYKKSSIDSIRSVTLTYKIAEDVKGLHPESISSSDYPTLERVTIPESTKKSKIPKFISNSKLYKMFKRIDFIPRLKRQIPLTHPLVLYILPLSYASLGV
jgi:hypothetical protein